MDDKIGFTSGLGEGMIDYVGSEKVLLDGMTMNVENPTAVPGIEDKAGQIKEPEMVFREEEVKENDVEEVGDEEDPKKEAQNDGNPKDKVNIEESNEEEARNDDRKEEVIIERKNADDPEEIEDHNEDPEEEVRNDENQNEELNIEENYENNLEEEVKNEEYVTNAARDEGKLDAISKKKVIKSRKKLKMLKRKKMALKKKVKNALVSISKPYEDGLGGNFDTEMISLPMLDNNNTPNDVGIGVVFSEQNHIVDDVDNELAISNRLKMNDVVLEDEEKKKHEIGKLGKEENTKEELRIGGDTRNDAKAKEKLEANSKKKANKKKDRKTKKDLRGKDEVVVNNRENPESSKRKTTTKDKCMGMIFMCNSKTKKDCYHYQVLGLPASKRDTVFEIYEGMKLFLFDFDLKLMYGIYEAAGPGGYNIEPKAFNSAFPSQVRFSVLEDCLPLAEEKFKKIIKDNYYSKNKFDCQLNSKQLENLCELFRVASKGSTFKQLNGSQNAEASAFADHGPKHHPRDRKAKGPRAEAPASVDRGLKQHPRGKKAKGPRAEAPASVGGESKQPRRKRKPEIPQSEAPIVLDRKAKRPRRSWKAETRPFVDPKPKRLQRVPREETQNVLYGDSRRHTLARDHMYLRDPVTYRREVYEPPLEHPPARQLLHLPLATSLLPSSEIDVYRRDQHHYRDLRHLDVNLRRQDEFDNRDYYINPLHPDGFNYRGSYLASSGHSSYRDPSSTAAQPPEYDPPASGRSASAYHTSAAPPSDYQSSYLGYRYYR